MANRGIAVAWLSMGALAAAGLMAAADGSRGAAEGVASHAEGSGLENSATPVSDDHGSVQAIRGIKGIDQVQLQNLEAVLRMQSPPPPPQPHSTRKAAALMTMGEPSLEEPLEIPDAREEYTEMEGS
jgi:hypothetical protein